MLRWLRRVFTPGVLLTGVVYVLLVALGVIAPYVIEAIRSQGHMDYSLLQITNVVWSLYEMNKYQLTTDRVGLVAIVLVLAMPAFLANLPAVAREVRHVRIEPPRRVVEEDAAAAA